MYAHRHTLYHIAKNCNTLQHAATHCNMLYHIASSCNTRQHAATHCNTLQHTATNGNTLQYTAAHCSTLQQIFRQPYHECIWITSDTLHPIATHGNTLYHTTTYCNSFCQVVWTTSRAAEHAADRLRILNPFSKQLNLKSKPREEARRFSECEFLDRYGSCECSVLQCVAMCETN